ncbi:hypothetical protein EHV10_13060 [Lachnoanaerobaculum gingivalis]|uniref:Uncharacterized protein n=1 Tax=Lachnoanaerobaculum gingivalis TaxID=2490855 RepID=A0A3P3QSZ6_9FIRM|nr:hypothetical protein [Lachnoanaerobaculum gingivalis]RRJ24322.1 hypothetical protein EHV10_13060 [Lachnoanaerobaculum gingivalis]
MNRLGKFKSTFHELEHYIDDLESLTDGSKYFEQALYNDFHNLEKSIRNGYNLNQEEAYKFISSHLIMEGNRIGGIQPYGEKAGATPTYFPIIKMEV